MHWLRAATWLALLVALLLGAWELASDARLLATDRAGSRRRALATSITFAQAGGVDLNGNFAMPPTRLPAGAQFIAFILRASSVKSDLAFWTAVDSELPARERGTVLLFGYCTGRACGALARLREPPPFPIIKYAEVNAWQALIAADADGRFIVSEPGHEVARLQWRGTASPRRIAVELTR
jgi:hypothetical protein